MPTPAYGTVYILTNTVTGKFYVGATTRPLSVRLRTHWSTARRDAGHQLVHLHMHMHRKWADEDFVIEPLATASSVAELRRLETVWTFVLGAYRRDVGYNENIGTLDGPSTREARTAGIRAALACARAQGKRWGGLPSPVNAADLERVADLLDRHAAIILGVSRSYLPTLRRKHGVYLDETRKPYPFLDRDPRPGEFERED
jgi:hypothetical protein